MKASQELKNKTLQNVMGKKQSHRTWHYTSILSVFACACVALILVQAIPKTSQPVSEPYTYITMDINPSLELILSKDNKVMEAKTYNDEAKNILDTLELKGQDVNDAVQTIILNEEFQVYLEEGFLQVSVFSNDEDKVLQVEENLNKSMGKILKPQQYGCSHVTSEEKKEADSHDISFGKYQVIQEIIGLDNQYQIEDLQNYSMRKLIELSESLGGSSYEMENNQGNRSCGRHGNGKGNRKGNSNRFE